MTSADDDRLRLIREAGIRAIDRRQFVDLHHDEATYAADPDLRRRYQRAEKRFLEIVAELTQGQGVSIFIDNLGLLLLRASLKALGRQGVITTAGWKFGEQLSVNRARECLQHHIHVHTHGFRDCDRVEATAFAEAHGWLPPDQGPDQVFKWADIPQLARAFEAGSLRTYFPLFRVDETS